jgi:hypothetical protein
MTPHHQSLSTQSRIPAVSRTNGLCVFEQPFLFLDACQALELGVKRVISQHEKFLSVKYRWVSVGAKVAIFHSKGL